MGHILSFSLLRATYAPSILSKESHVSWLAASKASHAARFAEVERGIALRAADKPFEDFFSCSSICGVAHTPQQHKLVEPWAEGSHTVLSLTNGSVTKIGVATMFERPDHLNIWPVTVRHWGMSSLFT